MANFPSLEPRNRTLTTGDFPQLIHRGLSGGNVRFLQGTDRIAQKLTIAYEYLTEAEMKLLLDHYQEQQGSLIPFDLPSNTAPTLSSSRLSTIAFNPVSNSINSPD